MTGHAVGTSRSVLPKIVSQGVVDYSPLLHKESERVVTMRVILQPGPLGWWAKRWLTRHGWVVEYTDDTGTYGVRATVEFRGTSR